MSRIGKKTEITIAVVTSLPSSRFESCSYSYSYSYSVFRSH